MSYINLAQNLGINVSSEDAEKLVKFAQQAYAAGEAAGIAVEREACTTLMAALRIKSRTLLFRSALSVAEGEIRARNNQ